MDKQVTAKGFANRQKQRGVTFVETLVALTIFSIGIMGIASIQFNVVTTNKQSYNRAVAAVIANDIVEKIRVNRVAALAGNYNLALTGATPAAPAGNCFGATADCSPAQMAAKDLADWRGSIDERLAGATSAVVVNLTAGAIDTVQVGIVWSPTSAVVLAYDL